MTPLDHVYHVGHLAIDREIREPPWTGPRTAKAEALHEMALKMWLNAERGKVFLYQRRCRFGFEYHCRMIRGVR